MLFTVLWIAWGVAFGVIEAVAIRNDKRDPRGHRTLSAHLRNWFHVNTHVGRTVWLVFSALFLVAWFIPHIAFG